MHPTAGLSYRNATVNPYLQIAPGTNAFSLACQNNSHSPSIEMPLGMLLFNLAELYAMS